MNTRRIAAVIQLDPDRIDEYERYHREVWPGVLRRLTESHMSNYSIFRHGTILFSYLEYTGDDYEADMAAIAADPETQRWWEVMNPMQQPFAERAEGEWWMTLPEVFHLD